MRSYRSQTVFLGDVYAEWIKLRSRLSIRSNKELAKLLLDSYNKDVRPKRKKKLTSTPGPLLRSAVLQKEKETDTSTTWSASPVKHKSLLKHLPTGQKIVSEGSSTWSAITAEAEASDSILSGIEALSSTSNSQSDIEISEEHMAPQESITEIDTTVLTARYDEISEYSGIDAGEECDPDDDTYVPSFWEMSINAPLPPDAADVSEEEDLDDLVHDFECDDDQEEVPDAGEEEDVSHSKDTLTRRLLAVDLEEEDDPMFMVSRSALNLLTQSMTFKCKKAGCKEQVLCHEKTIGCGVTLKWVCSKGHQVNIWTSQAVLPNNVLLGNMKFSAAIVLSGNNYRKVALMCKFLKVGIPSQTTFFQIQSLYVVPEVDKYWLNMKLTNQEEVRAERVVVAGDGRMDSPGYCAKYCTYTLINQADKNILALEVVDKRECNLKSPLMEATGFRRAIKDVEEAGINVTQVVTDAHPQIASIMKKEHGQKKHSWDMWHGGKNLGKKLCSAAAEKENSKLKPWIGHITNHFFHAAENCEGSEDLLKMKMASVLNHTVNRHSWALGCCDHGNLEDEENRCTEWLSQEGPEILALERILLDARFQNTLKYYVTCQTTSELESFNNHLLMYVSKRHAYSYPVYRCRCQLAAIDYTSHLNRPLRQNKNGEYYYKRYFSKAANQWHVKYVTIAKDYDYMPHIMTKILSQFCQLYKEKPLRQLVRLQEDDPRHIAPNIAPMQAPSTSELVEKMQPRLKTAWKRP